MTEKRIKTWEDCVAFHGHECGGLTIGYKASLYAIELLNLKFSQDEEVVCVTENDACGVDAIQVMLGCTVGKGNLMFRLRGKQAFNFYNRSTGKSVRLILRPLPEMDRSKRRAYMVDKHPSELFDVKPTIFALPEEARIFDSYACDNCGESTAEYMLRCENGKKLCPDCYVPYTRSF
jgi:formylmethanofuran dehydrogenase subunit E